eukprot:gene24843-30019_t
MSSLSSLVNDARDVILPLTPTFIVGFCLYRVFLMDFHQRTLLKLRMAFGKVTVSHANAAKYISRPSLESKLRCWLTNEASLGEHCIVYGPRGCGKSELVAHVASELPGAAVLVPITKPFEYFSSSACAIHTLSAFLNTKKIYFRNEEKAVIDAVKNAREPPTIVFDVSAEVTCTTTLGALSGMVRSVSPYCRCVLIISDPSQVMNEFGKKDLEKEHYIYVGEMARDEATNLLQRLTSALTAEDMQNVFDTVGTSPTTVKRLVSHLSDEPSSVSVKEFVANMLAQAREDLTTFPHAVLRDCLTASPSGVGMADLRAAVGQSEKKRGYISHLDIPTSLTDGGRCVIFRNELQRFELASTAHREALKTL